jgi:hypothetical protein
MPDWKPEAVTFNKDLVFLGAVKQKVGDMKWWRPWIHQLLLYVGTSRQGRGANQKKHIKERGIKQIEGPAPVLALPSPGSPQLRKSMSPDWSPT